MLVILSDTHMVFLKEECEPRERSLFWRKYEEYLDVMLGLEEYSRPAQFVEVSIWEVYFLGM